MITGPNEAKMIWSSNLVTKSQRTIEICPDRAPLDNMSKCGPEHTPLFVSSRKETCSQQLKDEQQRPRSLQASRALDPEQSCRTALTNGVVRTKQRKGSDKFGAESGMLIWKRKMKQSDEPAGEASL